MRSPISSGLPRASNPTPEGGGWPPPVSVDLLRGEVLGALVVSEDEGFIQHQLVLVENRLKGVNYTALLLRGRTVSVDDFGCGC